MSTPPFDVETLRQALSWELEDHVREVLSAASDEIDRLRRDLDTCKTSEGQPASKREYLKEENQRLRTQLDGLTYIYATDVSTLQNQLAQADKLAEAVESVIGTYDTTSAILPTAHTSP